MTRRTRSVQVRGAAGVAAVLSLVSVAHAARLEVGYLDRGDGDAVIWDGDRDVSTTNIFGRDTTLPDGPFDQLRMRVTLQDNQGAPASISRLFVVFTVSAAEFPACVTDPVGAACPADFQTLASLNAPAEIDWEGRDLWQIVVARNEFAPFQIQDGESVETALSPATVLALQQFRVRYPAALLRVGIGALNTGLTGPEFTNARRLTYELLRAVPLSSAAISQRRPASIASMVEFRPAGGGPGGTCNDDCTLTFRENLLLHAFAGRAETFFGWTGDCVGAGPCALIMDRDHAVTAWFNYRPRTVADFDGDGVADPTVFQHTSAAAFDIQLSGGGSRSTQWGGSEDVTASADYDGDGRADIAVFRPSDGGWYIALSNGGTRAVAWGGPGDLPVPADYDGDRKADVAVYRPSDGGWYVVFSTGAPARGLRWGQSGDVPVPADYDGDGKADFAVFRPSEGAWYVVKSLGGVLGVRWGTQGDSPVVGDFDGDRKADLGVYRSGGSEWYLLKSAGGATGLRWGISGDVPVVGDFDGDGRADVGVFRNYFLQGGAGSTTSAWYAILSGGGAKGISWGTYGVDPM